MYRAIVCIEEGFGALNGPNPVFRTEEGCYEYWLSRMQSAGPVIHSFRVARAGKPKEQTQELRYRMLNVILRSQKNLNGLDDDQAHERIESLYDKPLWILDCQAAVLQDLLWEKKYNRNKDHV